MSRGAPARRLARVRARFLLAFLALLLVARVLLLACGADVHGYGEEFAKGAAARLIVSDLRAADGGTGIPLWNVPYVLHEGGGTIVTLAKAALFLVVGPSVLANKLVALATTAATLLALLAAARELFGPRAAAASGLLFVFAPDAFLRFSLLSLGTHFEAAFFVAALAALSARIALRRDDRARAWFALGVASTLGAYASLVVLPALVVALARVGLARGRALVSRRGAALALGLVAGAAPWLWMVRNAGLDAVRVRGSGPGGGAAEPVRAFGILAERVFALDAGRLALVAGFVALCGAAAFVAVRARRGEHGETPGAVAASAVFAREAAWILATIALFLAAYGASGFALHPDVAWFFFLRTTPAWIGCVLLAGGAFAVLDERGRAAQTVGRALLALLVLVGALDAGRLALEGRPSAPVENLRLFATTQGYDWAEYLAKLERRLDGGPEEKLARLARIDDAPARLDPDLALCVFEHAGVPLPAALETLHRALGARAEGAIVGLRFFVHPTFGHDPDAAFAALATAREEDRPALAEAIGRAGLGPRFRADRLREQLERAVEPEWRERWLLGAGWRLYRCFPLRPDLARAFLDAQPPERRAALERGYARASEMARVGRDG